MNESPSSSFIPKRSPGKQNVVVRKKTNLIILPVISYALFVSAPLASAGVFIYEKHIQNKFDQAVVILDEEIASFKDQDLKRVNDFSDKMSASSDLLNKHVSINSVLRSIESMTADTIEFKSLTIKRKDDATLSIEGLLETSNFDGALFQRSLYASSMNVQNLSFSDTKITKGNTSEEVFNSDTVEVSVYFEVSVPDALYTPVTGSIEAPVTSDSSDVTDDQSDTEDINIENATTSTATTTAPTNLSNATST